MVLSIVSTILIILHLIAYHTIGYTIDCTTNPCRDTYIKCLPNEDCFINCTSTQSCRGATITCPLKGNCNILCSGGESCSSAIINATLSTGNFNLECEHCRHITIYGSILNTNTGNYNISCNGKQLSCANANIHCPLNTNCNIQCNSDTSCRWSQIIGSNNGNSNIKCTGIKSCQDAKFDGSKSLSLDINGCTNDESCLDLTLHCPPNTNGHKNCFIEGNNNLGRGSAGGTKIYAMNGWNDININHVGPFDMHHSGYMYCGENYDNTCAIAIASDKWSCQNDTDYCNFNYIPINNTIAQTRMNPTELYTTLDKYLMDGSDENTYYDHYLTKDRGIHWYLEVRIIFGAGVLIFIIIVTICCWIAHHTKKKSFYHWKQVQIPPDAIEINSIDINSVTFKLDSRDTPISKKSITPLKINTITNTLDNTITIKYNGNSVTHAHAIENIKSPKYNNNDMISEEKKTISDDVLQLNPIQSEIVAVRQLLNLRKLMIQKPTSHNSDDSDIGSADTNDIIERNRKKSYLGSVSNDEKFDIFESNAHNNNNNIVIDTYNNINKYINENEEGKTINMNVNNKSLKTIKHKNKLKNRYDGLGNQYKHKRTHGVPNMKSDTIHKINNSINGTIEESPSPKSLEQKFNISRECSHSISLSVPKQSIFLKQKSKSTQSQLSHGSKKAKRKRKITDEYIMTSVRGDSETEMDSRSDTNDNTTKSISANNNSTTSDNEFDSDNNSVSATLTYNHSQSVRPTAC